MQTSQVHWPYYIRILGNILCDLDPKVKVKGKKVGIRDGILSTAALVFFIYFVFNWGYLLY